MSRSGLTTRDRSGAARRTGDRGGTSPSPRPARRRPRSERRSSGSRRPGHRRRPVIGAIALAATLGGLLWLVWSGPVLTVSSVQVDGSSTVPADQVRETAGIVPGTPLLQVDVEAAEARVAALPHVASVEVTRGWPHSVVVTIVERQAAAVVGEPGRRMLIDAEGVLFDTVSGAAPAGVVPLVVDDPGPDDPTTMAALTAIGSFPAELREAVAGVRATSPEDISMALADGTLVEWGSAEDSSGKARALAALVDQIAAGALDPAGTIDVRAPGAVVLR